MDIKKLVGIRIGEIRNKKGITQEDLSCKIDINSKYLSSIERGKENPTLNTLIRIAESLEVELCEIFRFVQIEDPTKRKSLLISLLDEADGEQLKLAGKILSAIIR
ncbi:MAG: helix-turn-helix transcriptional regulator [Deltaproteobacteria bacterium]|nr:helix-turn-helix transcriptional regulator [Deltaproteobacteria bacterium]MBW2595678.1 helix-turn-helix transcriptional regulator [Deltaproteobacteria bacterium]